MFPKYTIVKRATGIALLVLAGAGGMLWLHAGAYGFNVIARHGGTYWITIGPDDARLPPAMRLALRQPAPVATPGRLVWRPIETGFDVADLPVIAAGRQVDMILLARIDPARYRFVARAAPQGDKGLDEWERDFPAALLIVNGSYYGPKGAPDTPFLSEGVAMGPATYEATGGAFVAGERSATVEDLSHRKWRPLFARARNAMVSYPLLLGDDGQSHVATRSRWLANRTFVGHDGSGRIVIGTTREAFFSLDRFAAFLKSAPLDLKVALNLDGGPLACQSVRLPHFRRKFYARWEAQVSGDQVKLLRWPIAEATSAMPVVLTVERRRARPAA